MIWASVRLFSFTAAGVYDRVGRERLEAKQYESAESYFAKSVRLAESNLDYRLDLGDCLYAMAGQAKEYKTVLSDLLQARQQYLKATALNPREGNGWLGLAQTCWWLSRFSGHKKELENVEYYFQHALSTDPNNGQFLYGIVGFYLAQPPGERTGLPADIEHLAAVYPQAYNDLKKLPNWTGERQSDFLKGLKIAASNQLTCDSALSTLAGIAVETKQWGEAASYTERLIRLREDSNPSCSAYFDLGYYRLMSGRADEAKKAFLHGLQISDNRLEALDNLLSRLSGSVHQITTVSLSAKGVCDLYLDLAKETGAFDPEVFSSRQMIRGKAYLYIAADLDAAAKCFHRAIQGRDSAAPHRYLADIASRRKDWDEMEMESHRATLLAPSDSELYCLLATALQNQQRYIAALQAIDEAIKHSPQPNAGYYNSKGWLYWAFNDYPDAIKAWEAAGRIDPKAGWPQSQIAKAYEMLKKK
ncbi:MAG: tetratricopeptide repeat protein [Syntrophobacteraceae bacterium]|nr:tetratricopeptide repeat protein [Syntrophobacteraceae bacterium]